ncbi:MAG: phosphoglycerate kinase [Planctomycetes bacterium]|nr:phosphoglycerate kinase [Planctomycetota bacterium]
MKTIRDLAEQLRGKNVLMRVDFNLPLDKKTGEITNDLRIRRAMPTIELARERGARVILLSHLGRPKGERVPRLSLRKVAVRLGELIGAEVGFVPDCIGPQVSEAVRKMQDGDLLMLENTRFHPGEKANDPDFARQLARPADIFINDAFGTAHRADASTVGVADYLPAAAGLLIEKEVNYLSRATSASEHPYVAIMGGAKVSDKIEVIRNLLDKVDVLLIGGAMAYTFLKQQGVGVGASLVEDDRLDVAARLLRQADGKIILPVDHVCGKEIAPDTQAKTFQDEIPDGWIGLDIGPRTAASYAERIRNAALVTWNGPVGYFEIEKFSEGTRAIARAMAGSSADTIIGGGETAEAVEALGLDGRMSHVSTGGGACLSFLGGEELPGIAALE